MRITKEKWDKLVALADKLANISRACEQLGISRRLYYKWIKTAESNPANPAASASTRRRHPHSIPMEVKNEILVIARDHPDWGCQRISYFLELKGKKASPMTVHKVLKENSIDRKSQMGKGKKEGDA